MEIKSEESECVSFVDCAFCLRKRNLKLIFEKNYGTSKYSNMMAECFDMQIKRVSEDLKICEKCIKKLSGALKFKHKLDCFIISKQSTEKVYKDNCSSDYSNLKLPFVVKNECVIDDCNDLESFVSEFESTSNFESDKDPKSNVLIDFEIDISTSHIFRFKRDENTKSSPSIDFRNDKLDNETEKPNGKSDKIHHPVKSASDNSNNFISIIEPSAFICPVCKEEFNSHTLLLQHYPNHNLNYVCDICGDAHVYKISLIKHLSKHALKQHQCEYSEKISTNKNNLSSHVRQMHEGENWYVCRLCPKRFSSYLERDQHQTDYHKIPAVSYVCPSCGKTCRTSNALSVHVREIHNKIYHFECTMCNKKFLRKSNLDFHFVRHTGEKNFKCTVCSEKFFTKRNLDYHLVRHTSEKNFECTVCDKKFLRKSDLDYHFVRHTGEKNFECTVCNKKFYHKNNMKKHFVLHTTEKNFECTVCNKKFFTNNNLNSHLIIHTGEKKFECTVCNKKFSRKWDLDYHIAIHTDEKNFECKLCNKKFSRKWDLDYHFVIHTGEKKFECTVCNKKFFRKGQLSYHFVIHTGEKKFECFVCNKKFYRKVELNSHYSYHMNDKDFECTACNKKFSTKYHLDNHFVIHTGEKM